jgi:DNA repair photolyase
VTTLDRTLARRMEPRAATPERRLETVRALNDAGIPAGIMAAPMIPALNDMELEKILEAGKAAGAISAGYVLLRLPHELKGLFREWLENHFPERAKHVLSLVTETHGGKLYDGAWGVRQRGTGPYAELLRLRFERASRKLGFGGGRMTPRLDTTLFRRPPQRGDQLTLF